MKPSVGQNVPPMIDDGPVERADLVGGNGTRFVEAAGVLHALRGRQLIELPLLARHEQVTVRPVAGVDADLVFEPQQLLARKKRQADIDGRPELRTKASRGASGAPLQ
jgi:hypothetical protein